MAHDWTLSWPGNMCKRCGADDPIEYAIGMGWYDPYEDKWESEDKRDLVLMLQQCLPELTEDGRQAIIGQIEDLEARIAKDDFPHMRECSDDGKGTDTGSAPAGDGSRD